MISSPPTAPRTVLITRASSGTGHEHDADRDSSTAAGKGLAHQRSTNTQVKGLGIHRWT